MFYNCEKLLKCGFHVRYDLVYRFRLHVKCIIKYNMQNLTASSNLLKFFNSGKKMTFKRGETILHMDSPPARECYCILNGYVKVVSYNKAGNERIHYIYGLNDLFPIGWLLCHPYKLVLFIAVCDVLLAIKSTAEFNEYVRKEPFSLSEVINMQLNLQDRIYNLNIDDSERRVAHRLLTLGLSYGVKDGPHIVINIPLTQQEFADTVKLSRETTGTVMISLETKGCIIIGRKRILINSEKLVELLED